MEDWKVYQSCYKNIPMTSAGGTTRNAWGPVAVSPDMPPDMREECRSYQQRLVTAQNPKDEDGQPLRLFQIIGGEYGIYVLRTRHGRPDPFGRCNLFFSHAFAFESGQVQENPEAFLNLAPENFKENTAELRDREGASLTCLPGMTGREAAFRYWGGISAAGTAGSAGMPGSRGTPGFEGAPGSGIPDDVRVRWAALVECVCGQQAAQQLRRNASVPPLYVQYDGDGEALRALLTALYAMLPYNLRRSLKLSTYTDLPGVLAGLNLVFTRRLPDSPRPEFWLNASTGENSVLKSAQIRKRLGRIRYANYAVRNLDPGTTEPGPTTPGTTGPGKAGPGKAGPGKAEVYFRNLELYARALGDLSAKDESLLKIVHISYLPRLLKQYCPEQAHLEQPLLDRDSVSDSDLLELLSEILRCKVRGDAIDRLLGAAWTEAYLRETALTDAMREALRRRAEASKNWELCAMPAYSGEDTRGKAAGRTNRQQGRRAERNPSGLPMEHWVDAIIQKHPPLTWELLSDIWKQYLACAAGNTDLEAYQDTIRDQISRCAFRDLYSPFAIPGGHAPQALGRYKNLLKELGYQGEKSQHPAQRTRYDDMAAQAKQAYWDRMTPDRFRFEEAYREYRIFAVHDLNSRDADRYTDGIYQHLSMLPKLYSRKNPQILGKALGEFFARNGELFPEEARRTIVSKLKDYLRRHGNRNISVHYLEECVTLDIQAAEEETESGGERKADGTPQKRRDGAFSDMGAYFEDLCTKYLLSPGAFDAEAFLNAFWAYKSDVEEQRAGGAYSRAQEKTRIELARAWMLGVAVTCDAAAQVPLDVWLEISDGGFEIFRKVNARILDTKAASPEDVVSRSELFAQGRYRRKARNFLKEAGASLFARDEAAKTVQKWLEAAENNRKTQNQQQQNQQ